MSSPNYAVRLDDEERYGEPYQVLRVERGGVVIVEQSDRGEPEDNSFARDWSWVPGALEKAYELGLEDGRRMATEQPCNHESKEGE